MDFLFFSAIFFSLGLNSLAKLRLFETHKIFGYTLFSRAWWYSLLKLAIGFFHNVFSIWYIYFGYILFDIPNTEEVLYFQKVFFLFLYGLGFLGLHRITTSYITILGKTIFHRQNEECPEGVFDVCALAHYIPGLLITLIGTVPALYFLRERYSSFATCFMLFTLSSFGVLAFFFFVKKKIMEKSSS